MNPSLAAFDFRWITDHVGLVIFVFFFFVVPILNGLKKSLEQKRESESRSQKSPEEVQTEEQSARRTWEDLMRGDAPARTSAAPPALPVPPPIQRLEPVKAEPEPEPLTGRLSDLEDAPSEDEEESTYDEEKLARDQNEARLREEMQRRADFATRTREPAARKTVAATDMTASEFGAEALAAASSVIARRRDLLGLDGDRRAALRRAIVAGEVFGRPLALRRPFDTDHP